VVFACKQLRVQYLKKTAKQASRRAEKHAGQARRPLRSCAVFLALQKLIARLQEMSVQGVEPYSLYITPLDGYGVVNMNRN